MSNFLLQVSCIYCSQFYSWNLSVCQRAETGHDLHHKIILWQQTIVVWHHAWITFAHGCCGHLQNWWLCPSSDYQDYHSMMWWIWPSQLYCTLQILQWKPVKPWIVMPWIRISRGWGMAPKILWVSGNDYSSEFWLSTWFAPHDFYPLVIIPCNKCQLLVQSKQPFHRQIWWI